MPPFFIIIPVYRSGPFLRDCLDSIRNQTLTDWECICINDGSPDDSGAILDEYARKDARFTAIHQDNRGVSAARNAGLSVARELDRLCGRGRYRGAGHAGLPP
ncbi:MAG: glycosyltransferase family 2 protein [Akkermansia muciniphila]